MLTIANKFWLIKKYQKQFLEVKMKFFQINEDTLQEIKRDLRNPMVQRGLIMIGVFFLFIIYHVLCWFTFCG